MSHRLPRAAPLQHFDAFALTPPMASLPVVCTDLHGWLWVASVAKNRCKYSLQTSPNFGHKHQRSSRTMNSNLPIERVNTPAAVRGGARRCAAVPTTLRDARV